MGFDFTELPRNNDFSSWKSPLEDQIKKYCGDAKEFPFHSLRWGYGFLTNLRDEDTTERLYNYIDPDNADGLKPWTSKRWWMIFIIALAIVLLITFIILAIVATKKSSAGKKPSVAHRQFFQKSAARNGKLEILDRAMKVFTWSTYLTVLLGLLFGVFTLIGNSQIIIGHKKTNCAMWLEVYGHYFGGQNITSSPDMQYSVATNWDGTQNLLLAMRQLEPSVKPGAENPIYRQLTALREPLVERLQKDLQDTVALMTDAQTTAQKYDDLLVAVSAAVKTAVSGGKGFVGWTTITADYIPEKIEQVVDRLQSTLKAGSAAIDLLLEKYAGPNSYLLNRAYQSLNDAREIISQVDLSVAAITKKWVDLEGSLKGAVLSSSIIGLISASGIILALLVLCLLGRSLSKAFKKGLPAKRHRNSWLAVYWVLLVGAGLQAFLIGMDLLIAGLGADLCEIADQKLFSEGRWRVLGDEAVYPRGREMTTVDMAAVFDTCVKESGAGDISSVLGLELRIQDLRDGVDAAIEEIQTNRAALSANPDTDFMVRNLRFALQLAHKYYYRKPVMPFRKYAQPQLEDLDSQYGSELVSSLIVGQSSLLLLLQHGLWAEATSPGEFYDYINEFVDDVNANITLTPTTSTTTTSTTTTPATTTTTTPATTTTTHPASDSTSEFSSDSTSEFSSDSTSEFSSDDTQETEVELMMEGDNQPVKRKLQAANLLPHFCGALGVARGSKCGEQEEPIVWLDQVVPGIANDITGYVSLVPANFVWRDYLARMTTNDRLGEALWQLILVEKMYAFNDWSDKVEMPTDLGCSDTSPCTYNDVREKVRDMLTERGNEIYETFQDSNAAVQEYIDGAVVPLMNQVAEAAEALTDGANCQFEGTALRLAVVDTLCKQLFPGVAISAIWSLLFGILTLTAAYITRFWMYVAEALSGESLDSTGGGTPVTAARGVEPTSPPPMGTAQPEAVNKAEPITKPSVVSEDRIPLAAHMMPSRPANIEEKETDARSDATGATSGYDSA